MIKLSKARKKKVRLIKKYIKANPSESPKTTAKIFKASYRDIVNFRHQLKISRIPNGMSIRTKKIIAVLQEEPLRTYRNVAKQFKVKFQYIEHIAKTYNLKKNRVIYPLKEKTKKILSFLDENPQMTLIEVASNLNLPRAKIGPIANRYGKTKNRPKAKNGCKQKERTLKIIEELKNNIRPYQEIANKFKVKRSTITCIASKYGLSVPGRRKIEVKNEYH